MVECNAFLSGQGEPQSIPASYQNAYTQAEAVVACKARRGVYWGRGDEPGRVAGGPCGSTWPPSGSEGTRAPPGETSAPPAGPLHTTCCAHTPTI